MSNTQVQYLDQTWHSATIASSSGEGQAQSTQYVIEPMVTRRMRATAAAAANEPEASTMEYVEVPITYAIQYDQDATIADDGPGRKNVDFNAMYTQCYAEIDQAISSSKSQKIKQQLNQCKTRLRELHDVMSSMYCQLTQTGDLNKEVQELRQRLQQYEQLEHHDHVQGHQYQEGVVHNVQETLPTSYEEMGDQLYESTQQNVGIAFNPSQESKISKRKSDKGGNLTPSPRKKPKTRSVGVQKENLDNNALDVFNLSSNVKLTDFNKEDLVREARERAQLYDFGELTTRYNREAILDMIESAGRESIRAFLNHKMVEQDNDTNNSKRASYICKEPNCQARFSQHISALTHCLTYHFNKFKPCACDQCDKKFYLKIDLRYHYSRHSNIYRFSCPIEGCEFKCNRPTDFKVHAETHDTSVKKYICNACGKKFSARRTLRLHQQLHTGQKFKCHKPGCGRDLNTRIALSNHLKRHEAIESGKFKCQFCEYTAATSRSLKNHLLMVHDHPHPLSPEEKEKLKQSHKLYNSILITCEQCNKSVRKGAYNRHLKSMSCLGAKNESNSDVARARLIKTAVTCPYCHKTILQSSFRSHVKRFHPAESSAPIRGPYDKRATIKDPMTCPHCRQIKSKTNMWQHLKRMHPQHYKPRFRGTRPRGSIVNPVRCSVCQLIKDASVFRYHFKTQHPLLEYNRHRAIKIKSGAEEVQDINTNAERDSDTASESSPQKLGLQNLKRAKQSGKASDSEYEDTSEESDSELDGEQEEDDAETREHSGKRNHKRTRKIITSYRESNRTQSRARVSPSKSNPNKS